MSRRPVLIPVGCALVVLAALWAAADAHPVVRPTLSIRPLKVLAAFS